MQITNNQDTKQSNLKDPESIDHNAKIIWDYLRISHTPEKVDCMIVLGSYDTRVAEHAAQLMINNYSPRVIFSGAKGRNTEGLFSTSEAEYFASIAIKKGVAESKIDIEPCATNTGSNILFSKRLLESKNIKPDSFMLVQKPYMGRRAFTNFRVHFPEEKVLICCPDLSYEQFPNNVVDKTVFINSMVGDLQRIKEYPKLGYQIYQDIPESVWTAFENLVAMGFDTQLI